MTTSTLKTLRHIATGICVLLLLFALFGSRSQLAHDYGPHYLAFCILIVIVDVLLARAVIKRERIAQKE